MTEPRASAPSITDATYRCDFCWTEFDVVVRAELEPLAQRQPVAVLRRVLVADQELRCRHLVRGEMDVLRSCNVGVHASSSLNPGGIEAGASGVLAGFGWTTCAGRALDPTGRRRELRGPVYALPESGARSIPAGQRPNPHLSGSAVSGAIASSPSRALGPDPIGRG